MQTTSGLLTVLDNRFGWLRVPLLLVLSVLLALVVGLVLMAALELLPATDDAVRVAPLRWASAY